MQHWHTLSIQEIFDKLKTGEQGLREEEVSGRKKSFGENILPKKKRPSSFVIFINQFKSSIIYILLLSSIVVFLMGDHIDALFIFIVLIINSVIGAFQEGKAEDTLSALEKFVKTEALVKRDGVKKILLDTMIVPGDIVFLKEGDKVPADGRIFDSHSLKTDESVLTGESTSVNKHENIIEDKDITFASQENMVFRGSYVVSGHAYMVVTAVGVHTEVGKISKALEKIDTEIPLKKNIKELSKIIVITVFILSAIVFALGIMRGMPATTMFKTGVAIAVSVIPEGLPVVVTLILARGVFRMSKRNALVRKLQAVETLGQARVIAVDKTGTITMNQMMVNTIYTHGEFFSIEGNGYSPIGEIKKDGKNIEILNDQNLIMIGKISALTAIAGTALNEKNKIWERVYGDPTEVSLLVLSQKIGFHKNDLLKESPIIEEFPFDFKKKYHATVNNINNEKTLLVAGAPEVVLSASDKILLKDKIIAMSDEIKKDIKNAMKEMSSQGLRILVLGYRPKFTNMKDGVLPPLVFVGMLGIADTLRKEVKESVIYANNFGVKVVMITGDHKDTAEAIARQASIFKDGDIVVTGDELHQMDPKTFKRILPKVSVFARVTPKDKMKIIEAYRANKDVVAMTGDGVNDALSLAAADLGVSMGISGTEVAKEASDIVLMDDNFRSIVHAIGEGRSIYATIKKVVLYLFSTGVGEMFVLVLAISLALPLPVSATQIIWLNFVTDGFLVVALALGPRDNSLIHKNSHGKIVDKAMVTRIILQGATMIIGTIMVFKIYLPLGYLKATTIAMTMLAVFQWFNIYNVENDKLLFRKKIKFNFPLLVSFAIVVVLHLFVVYAPVMQNLLKTTSITLYDWLVILVIGLSVIAIDLIWKLAHKFSIKNS